MSDSCEDLLYRIELLRREHNELDQSLEKLARLKQTDQLQLQLLKRRKLKLKDMITHIENELIPDQLA